MNRTDLDILKSLFLESYQSQRILSDLLGYSLGTVNKSLKRLADYHYIDNNFKPTNKTILEFKRKSPKNAIILAGGYGMGMIPINRDVPKAFLDVFGESLIERIIRQLHEAGITDIIVVVGYMKERYDYLIDKYGVTLLVNPDYSSKNNLHSLALAADYIANSYIIPSDIWCRDNPFSRQELYSWYMVSDMTDADSDVRVNRKLELVKTGNQKSGNKMIGIAYLLEDDAITVIDNLTKYASMEVHDSDFWEVSLYVNNKMLIPAKVVPGSDVVEINTYEQLRELDHNSSYLKSEVLDTIASVFHVENDEIADISVLKKGMTNRSFRFTIGDEKYIMRIPGEGTEMLINRQQEADVFRAIRGYGLCDDPVFIDPEKGYKISALLDHARVCNAQDSSDVGRCMKKLRLFHELKLMVSHTFDIFKQIDFYESLWDGKSSMYDDYRETKSHVLSLKPFIDSIEKEWVLTHIDAVPDNFLFYPSEEGEQLQLTDWEYSGMQDPHVDIAMFAIYALYSKPQVDSLIDTYFQTKICDDLTRAKIYAYISMCGLLWSNWCEYKSRLGVEFGEYSLRQYRYAKDYYKYSIELQEAQSRNV